MASATQTASNTEGNVKTTATYSVDTSGLGYSIITDDIKADFNFLVNELPQKLDNVLSELASAVERTDAFNFDGVNTLEQAQQEIIQDVTNLKNGLNTLYTAFMTDIDNVNAELSYNYGWPLFGEIKKDSIRSETIQTDTQSN